MIKLKEISIKKIISIIIMVIISSIAILMIIGYLSEKNEENVFSSMSNVNQKIDEIIVNTKDGESAGQSLKKEFTNLISEDLKHYKGNDKTVSAAYFVLGGYLANARGLYDFCNDNGVDVSNFITSYKNINSGTYNSLMKIIKNDAKSSGIIYDENAIYHATKESIYKVNKLNMSEITEKWKLKDIKATCELFNAKADKIVVQLLLEESMFDTVKIVNEGVSRLK